MKAIINKNVEKKTKQTVFIRGYDRDYWSTIICQIQLEISSLQFIKPNFPMMVMCLNKEQ